MGNIASASVRKFMNSRTGTPPCALSTLRGRLQSALAVLLKQSDACRHASEKNGCHLSASQSHTWPVCGATGWGSHACAIVGWKGNAGAKDMGRECCDARGDWARGEGRG
eukprot:15445017-Alexandrium_andersonii.AAC.1